MQHGVEHILGRSPLSHAMPPSTPVSPFRVAVFDLDGTLLQSSGVDDRAYQRAAKEHLGLASISLDWNDYPHSTDDAIAWSLVQRARGRTPMRAEVDAFQQAFLRVLEEEMRVLPSGVQPLPGADAVAEAALAAGWTPALATGCWRASAHAKLAAAGLQWPHAAAFSDDAWPRQGIIQRAVERAAALAGADSAPAAHVVYLGDGTWDVRACRSGGYRYVGIAEGQRAQALRLEGAGTVLAHYADVQRFLEALKDAQVPRRF